MYKYKSKHLMVEANFLYNAFLLHNEPENALS
jgi:hypothetical protein